MAYSKEDLEKEALHIIETLELPFIEYVVAHLPCNKSTFYNHKLHELDSIKEAIEFQKISKKQKLQNKWMDSDNATAQIALYKLLSNELEFAKLCGQQLDHTSKGDKVSFNVIKSYD